MFSIVIGCICILSKSCDYIVMFWALCSNNTYAIFCLNKVIVKFSFVLRYLCVYYLIKVYKLLFCYIVVFCSQLFCHRRTVVYFLLYWPNWLCTVKPVLSSHPREAQKVAAEGRWLLSSGEYQYKINVWEHSVWLHNKGDR